MQKYLMSIVVAFQALALGSCMVRGGFEPVALFLISSLLLAALYWIESHQIDDKEVLVAEMTAMRNEINALKLQYEYRNG